MKKTILFAASVFVAMSVWAESTVVEGVTWYYSTYQEWHPSSQSYVTYAQITSGAALDYVNVETRLGLSPSGYRQYGWKIVGD